MGKIIGVILAVLIVHQTALAEDKESVNKKVKFQAKEDGGYESSAVTETISETGVKETVKTEERVDITKDGVVKGTVKTDTRTNPSGLLNETWKQEQATNVIRPDGSAELEANAKAVKKDGTRLNTTLKTVSKIGEDGSTRTTSEQRTTVDPKGMLNKSVVETSKVIEKDPDGSTTTKVERKVNGQLVESE